MFSISNVKLHVFTKFNVRPAPDCLTTLIQSLERPAFQAVVMCQATGGQRQWLGYGVTNWECL
jgi:hypothetical protein